MGHVDRARNPSHPPRLGILAQNTREKRPLSAAAEYPGTPVDGPPAAAMADLLAGADIEWAA
jgi:hypothetical protein